MLETNKIAVLMATYNGEKYVAEQIDSLLAQTEKSWELFIHDDGSTDHTADVLKKCREQNPDQIHILSGPACNGAKDNFFFLMRQVKAPYVLFCDQDDVWLPEKIELEFRRIKELEAQFGTDTPILVFSDLSVVDSKLNLIAEKMSVYQKLDPGHIKLKDLMIQNVITGCTVMMNRALAEKALQVQATDSIIMHDWWCALAAACFGKISYVDRPLVLYRQHGENSVGAKDISSLKYLTARLKKRQDIKNSLTATQRQTEFFVNTYNISDPALCAYGRLGARNKVRRLWFYAKNHIRKSGWQRNLGLLIWG
ncbi:MAG: glycosyltransferase family 2 protein [Eubacteriales bacterium]|nr:glycosyltransferase family 2 protein [Eubacteriales bacterium]